MTRRLSDKWFGIRGKLCWLIGHYATPYPGKSNGRYKEPLMCHYCLQYTGDEL